MQLKSKRVGGEKIAKLTLTKTEISLLERAEDLMNDIADHCEGDHCKRASNGAIEIGYIRESFSPQEQPSKV